jgi:hypothetical protein
VYNSNIKHRIFCFSFHITSCVKRTTVTRIQLKFDRITIVSNILLKCLRNEPMLRASNLYGRQRIRIRLNVIFITYRINSRFAPNNILLCMYTTKMVEFTIFREDCCAYLITKPTYTTHNILSYVSTVCTEVFKMYIKPTRLNLYSSWKMRNFSVYTCTCILCNTIYSFILCNIHSMQFN